VLLRIPTGLIWLAALASLLTIISGIGYLSAFIRRERVSGRSSEKTSLTGRYHR
jgi:hypothetical protein